MEKLFTKVEDSCPSEVFGTYIHSSDTIHIDSLIKGSIQTGSVIWLNDTSTGMTLSQDLGGGYYLISVSLNQSFSNYYFLLLAPTNYYALLLPTDTNYCISYRKRAQQSIKIQNVGFECFPSPSSEFITVQNPVYNSTLFISDINGKKLIMRICREDKIIIDIHDLEPGIYIIHDNYGNTKK